jgi:hypothetical protein
VSRPSYPKALSKLLQPLGFQRDGYDWIRIRGNLWECVNLQISWVAGVTANVEMKDLETEKVLQSIPCDPPIFLSAIGIRIGHLIDRRDRWWKNDPNGPEELTEAVNTYGLPWFDTVRTIEDQAAQWYDRGGASQWRSSESPLGRVSPWRSSSILGLAATLYRMGEFAEARALFDAPVPKTANPRLLAQGRCVQQWLNGEAEASTPTT